MSNICFLASLALLVPVGFSQHLGRKSCGSFNIQVVNNFNVTAYGGLWYEYEKYPFIFQKNLGCVTAKYTLKTDGTVEVVNSGRNVNTGKVTSITGKATLSDPKSGEAKLTVTFFGLPDFLGAPYWILDTDYHKYAVVWSCTARLQFLWILLRKLDYYDEVKSKIDKVLYDAGISRDPLVLTSNDPNVCNQD